MTQWKKKILNRKNGKRTVTEAKDDDEVKATKVLKFTPATSQKDAKEDSCTTWTMERYTGSKEH